MGAVCWQCQKPQLQRTNILLFFLKPLPTQTTFTLFADEFMKVSCMSSKHHGQSLFQQCVREAPSNEPCFTEALLEWWGHLPTHALPVFQRKMKEPLCTALGLRIEGGSMTALNVVRNPLF